ncbi:MAG: Ig-like domain-containing protein [bacterium]|nr:Ig-like domain-containing protein [bacterium]
MRDGVWGKKIPTLLGVILVLAGLIFTSYAVRLSTNFFGRAAPAETPLNIRVSNISDSSFAISYTTAGNIIGSVSFGENKNLGTTIADDRDQQSGNYNPYQTHYFTTRNLKPNTKYFYSITSGQTTYLNNDVLFETSTGPSFNTNPSGEKPVLGKVLLPEGEPPKEAIVYVTIPQAQVISTLVKQDGTYILPLNSIRTKDLNSYFSFSQNPILQILIVNPLFESNASFKTGLTNTIPIVILSKNYDFTIDMEPIASLSASLGFPSYTASASSKIINPQIIVPKKEETFSDPQPLFKGTAPVDSDVKIIINSTDEIKADVKTDNRGNWSYRPPAPLAPGQHTISITAKDQFGIFKTLTQSFVVYAEGSQVNQTATPSATPTINLPTPTPTVIASPTPIPTFSPSPTPIPTIIITPTNPPKKILPVVGNSSLITATATILITTLIGIILFLITRKTASL